MCHNLSNRYVRVNTRNNFMPHWYSNKVKLLNQRHFHFDSITFLYPSKLQ